MLNFGKNVCLCLTNQGMKMKFYEEMVMGYDVENEAFRLSCGLGESFQLGAKEGD